MEELASEMSTAIKRSLVTHGGSNDKLLKDGMFYATNLLHVEKHFLEA